MLEFKMTFYKDIILKLSSIFYNVTSAQEPDYSSENPPENRRHDDERPMINFLDEKENTAGERKKKRKCSQDELE